MGYILLVFLMVIPFVGSKPFESDDPVVISKREFELCGRTLRSHSGYISTPNYPHNYPDDIKCIYSIRPKNISLFVAHFYTCACHLESAQDCQFDYLTLGNGGKICGNASRQRFSALSFNGMVNVTFLSDESVNFPGCNIVYAIQSQGNQRTNETV